MGKVGYIYSNLNGFVLYNFLIFLNFKRDELIIINYIKVYISIHKKFLAYIRLYLKIDISNTHRLKI